MALHADSVQARMKDVERMGSVGGGRCGYRTRGGFLME